MRRLLMFIFSMSCAISPLSAQGNGIVQASDFVTVGSNKSLRWAGMAMRVAATSCKSPILTIT